MNLTEIERLVGRITELMRDLNAVSPAVAGPLAEQYAQVCRETGLRLDQCAAVLGTGNVGQVIQLAESQPPLLEVMLRLGFPKSQAWLEFCARNGLPTAQSFDGAVIRQLNDAYAQGIPPSHPLYREYRGLTMKGKFDEALVTLRSILRLNPGDENARRELARVEKQVAEARLKSLAAVVAGGNREKVLNAVDELDALGMDAALLTGTTGPYSNVYARATKIREALLLEEAMAEWLGFVPQLKKYHAAGRRQDAAGLLKHMATLRTPKSPTPPAEATLAVAEVSEWVARQMEEERREAEFAGVVGHLETVLAEAEHAMASRSFSGEAAMQTALGKVHNCWRALERFGCAVPPALPARYQRCCTMLEATMQQARSVRSRWMAAAAAAVFAIVGTVTYIVIANTTAARLVQDLEGLAKARQVAATRKMVNTLSATHGNYLARRDVAGAVAEADAFIRREESLFTAFDEAAKTLETALNAPPSAPTPAPVTTAATPGPRTGSGGSGSGSSSPGESGDTGEDNPAADAAAQTVPAAAPAVEPPLIVESKPLTDKEAVAMQLLVDRASAARDALAEEFRIAATPRLGAALNTWQSRVDTTMAERSARFRTSLAELEQDAQANLVLSRKVEELKPAAARFFAKLEELSALEEAPIPALKIPGDLATRLTTLKERTAPVRKALAELDGNLAALATATKVQDYLEAVKTAARNPLNFSGKAAMEAVEDMKPDESALVLALIFDGERDAYEFHVANPKAELCPTTPLLPPERKVYEDVLTDPNIRNVFRYIVKGPGDTEQSVVSRGRLDTDGQGMIYNQNVMPKRLYFSTGQVVVKNDLGRTEVSQTMEDINYRNMVEGDPSQLVPGTGGTPVLRAIELVARRKLLSSQFKAYFTRKMYEMMTAGRRELFFGLQYCPALKQLMGELRRANPTVSGSWFVVNGYKEAEAPLTAIFEKVGALPFAQQARVLHRLTNEAVEEGFAYQGFVDHNGKLHKHSPSSTPSRIFGWSKATGKPALLFTRQGEDGAATYMQMAEGMPYTPCFAYRGSPETALDAAQRTSTLSPEEFEKAVTRWLPPLFKQ